MKRLFNKNKSTLREVRHIRVRKVLIGTAAVPRLSVFRSLKGMVAQLIDDEAGKTLCYADSKEVKEKKAEDRSHKAPRSNFTLVTPLALAFSANNFPSK